MSAHILVGLCALLGLGLGTASREGSIPMRAPLRAVGFDRGGR